MIERREHDEQRHINGLWPDLASPMFVAAGSKNDPAVLLAER
jgi:hypothetical protein